MLTSLRAQLVQDLSVTDMPVFTQWPTRITPPCLFVTPSSISPYVRPGDAFGGFLVALDVVALTTQATPDIALPALDAVIEKVLANTVDWQLESCDGPSLVTVSGVEYLGTIVHISKHARL
jgi:hypothetical protein